MAKKRNKVTEQELHPSQVEALEQLAEAKEKLDNIPLEELKEIADLDTESTENIVMVGNNKEWAAPTEELPDYTLQPTYELTGNLQEEGAQEKLDEVAKEFEKKNKESEEALYRAMVEDGLIVDASEEILPGVNLDDEWRKYQEEHAAKLPPVDAILKPVEISEPFVPPVIPEKRESFINLKPPVRVQGPATVQAVPGVQGHNRPRFMGGR